MTISFPTPAKAALFLVAFSCPAIAQAFAFEGLGSLDAPTSLAAFFGAGLALALTPCVLPVAPILFRAIAGSANTQGRTKGASLALALSFCAGLALIYALAGLAAALAGKAFTQYTQSSTVQGVFFFLLCLMGASSLGAFSLSLNLSLFQLSPKPSQGFAHASLRGLALGMASALGAGPCVAPPLAAALGFVSAGGDPLLGFAKLFALGLGMGFPIAALGAGLGGALPKPGAWCLWVEKAMGCALLGSAAWMAFPFFGFTAVWMALGAGSMALAAAHWRKRTSTSHAVGSWIGLAFVLSTLASMSEYAPAQASASPLKDIPSQAPKPSFLAPMPISTLAKFKVDAAASQKPSLVIVHAAWCIECKSLREKTFPSPQAAALFEAADTYELDATAMGADAQEFMKAFGIFGPPAVLAFKRGSAELEAKTIGAPAPEAFAKTLSPAFTPTFKKTVEHQN